MRFGLYLINHRVVLRLFECESSFQAWVKGNGFFALFVEANNNIGYFLFQVQKNNVHNPFLALIENLQGRSQTGWSVSYHSWEHLTHKRPVDLISVITDKSVWRLRGLCVTTQIILKIKIVFIMLSESTFHLHKQLHLDDLRTPRTGLGSVVWGLYGAINLARVHLYRTKKHFGVDDKK